MKKLTDLRPQWTGVLRKDSGEGVFFDCPTCGPKHRIGAYLRNPLDGGDAATWHEALWNRVGESFEALTIQPSISYPCFHGWVERGLVFDISESPLVIAGRFVGHPEQAQVSLSPEQAANVARSVLALVEKMWEAGK